jgi:hypothetical protein
MACSINLNNQLTNHTTGGYFVYLGYSSTTNLLEDPNGENSTCFGIEDHFAMAPIDPSNPYTESPGTAFSVNPQIKIEPNEETIDFGGASAGFYGFAYIVGDNNPEDGELITPTECGDTTCFEIEVLDSPNMTAPTSNLVFCESSLPVDYDLTVEIGNYISGGTWGITGSPSPGTIDNTTGIITFTTPAEIGSFTVTYTLSVSGGHHDVDLSCTDCTQVITFILEITEASVAGTATSLAVCN